MMHVYGNSDAGAYSWITIEGGRLKLQKDKATAGSPNANTFDHVCMLYDARNGQPEAAFYFDGVTAGGNTITNSKAALIAGKNSVVAINATTGNAATSLYISPATITTSVDGTSWFTLTTQTTTAPALLLTDRPRDLGTPASIFSRKAGIDGGLRGGRAVLLVVIE